MILSKYLDSAGLAKLKNWISRTFSTKTELLTHTGNTQVHVSTSDRAGWAETQSEVTEMQKDLVGAMHWIGITTTEISDGSTTNPVVINGNNVMAVWGDVCSYGGDAFVWSGSMWLIFGSGGTPSDLGELAYKDSASGAYTPAGSVSQPTFTGTAAALTMKGTPAGTVSQPTFTGTPASFSMSGTPAGTVSQPTFTGTPASFSMSGTPTGSVSAPTVTVTPTTTSVDTLSAVGTLPSLTFTVTGEDLAIGWSAGTLPTQGSATVMTGASATASAPTFTGDGMDFDVEYTPEGTVSQPTFTGSAMSATASYTPEGTVSQPTFSGSEMSLSASYTPEGTVSQPAFTGTPAAITVS